MITKNKIVLLALLGLVVGGILGVVVNTGQINMVSLGLTGGAVGFLTGWIWHSRSGEA